jgi:hypothetical protein
VRGAYPSGATATSGSRDRNQVRGVRSPAPRWVGDPAGVADSVRRRSRRRFGAWQRTRPYRHPVRDSAEVSRTAAASFPDSEVSALVDRRTIDARPNKATPTSIRRPDSIHPAECHACASGALNVANGCAIASGRRAGAAASSDTAAAAGSSASTNRPAIIAIRRILRIWRFPRNRARGHRGRATLLQAMYQAAPPAAPGASAHSQLRRTRALHRRAIRAWMRCDPYAHVVASIRERPHYQTHTA